MGYKIIRSTVVLAMHSAALREIQTPDLERTLKRVVEVNYDMARLTDEELESLYAYFDDAFTDKVKAEFEFGAGAGDVIVHSACEATCLLCGKGDSKDTGDNKDQIRFEFKLSNHAGGRDVWCGSTCIINFGLKVRGAQTAQEAKDLLGKAMRNALRLWKIRQWQAEHPDHEKIPALYEEMRRQYINAYTSFVPLMLLGVYEEASTLARATHGLKLAVRHYQRYAYLPPAKEAAWDAAKRASWVLRHVVPIMREAENQPTPKARLDYLLLAADRIAEVRP